MKTGGYIRKMDNLGRIVIPMEVRKKLKITENDSLEIFSDSSSIVMKKIVNSCVLCDSDKNLLSFNEKKICKKCISKIKDANI